MKRPKPRIDPVRVLAGLRPEQLDTMTGDSYARRREQDLATALATPRPLPTAGGDQAAMPRPARRRGLVAATAATGLAVATALAVAFIAAPPPGPGAPSSAAGDQPPGQGQQAADPADARRVWDRDARPLLLLSARRIGQSPDRTGRFWYTRVRRADLNVVMVGVAAGSTDPAPGGRVPEASPGKACEKAPADSGGAAFVVHVHTVETWSPVTAGDRGRVVSNQDPEARFPSPADERRLRRAGVKPPWPDTPEVEDLGEAGVGMGDGARRLTMAEVRALPTTADGLEADLRRLFEERRRQLAAVFHGSPTWFEFPTFVWSAASVLLPAPTTPETKAAFYELLARQRQGIRLVGEVTDPLGRAGVAFGWPNHDPATGKLVSESRLIIEPKSGRLLAQDTIWVSGQKVVAGCEGANGKVRGYGDVAGKDQPIGWTAYEASGWTDRLGARP